MAASSLSGLHAPPVFVVGAARSGTTWVFDAYRAHPQVAGVFESMLFARLHGLGGLLHDDHWRDPRTGLGALASRDEVVDEIRELASGWLSRALRPEHHFLVEKTPAHGLVMAEIAAVFPDCRFVNVVRDGRDVSVSRRAASRTWATTWARFPGVIEVARSARRWRREVNAACEAAASLGERVLEVRYEELHHDPRAGYARLYDFAGIPYDDELLARVHQGTDFELSGRAADASGFYRGGRIGDWRRSFNVVDGLVFNALAGDTLVSLGYEPTRWWRASWHRALPVATTR